MDKAPDANILKDPSVASYKADPRFGGYQNTIKRVIENPNLDQAAKDELKRFEQGKAELFYGKAQAGFSLSMAAEEQLQPWAR